MTIYKPKPADRKADIKKSPLKGVVVQQDTKPLAPTPIPAADHVRVIQARRRRSALLFTCCILFVVLVILIVAIGGYFLYFRLSKKMHHQHAETAEVKYFEYDKSDGKKINVGSFIENVEIDDDDYLHERLDVPSILKSRRSTVMHDFEKNLTAIVDRDSKRCFVMPLNRTAVQPPRSFLDLLNKYKSNYYIPDAEIVRENYKVSLPHVDDVEQFGFYIWFDCRMYTTYLLVRDDEPRMISKRSACELAGETYCLGGAGATKMMCVQLTSCT